MIAVKDNSSMAFIDVKNIKLLEEFDGDTKVTLYNSTEALKIFRIKLEAFETLVGNCLEKPSDLHVLQASFIFVD